MKTFLFFLYRFPTFYYDHSTIISNFQSAFGLFPTTYCLYIYCNMEKYEENLMRWTLFLSPPNIITVEMPKIVLNLCASAYIDG